MVAFLLMMSGSDDHYPQYSTVTGYFKQDDPATDPKGFDYVCIIMVWSFDSVTILLTSLRQQPTLVS